MIEIFTTGGTIDKIYFDALSEYQVGPSAVAAILRENNVHAPHRVTQLMRKDSLDIDAADRAAIRTAIEASNANRILVTHGTDTMVETARALGGIAGKTIVLTGALQPASLKHSDAEFNIGFALAAVQVLPEGVHVAMNGQILDPSRTRKDREAGRFVAD